MMNVQAPSLRRMPAASPSHTRQSGQTRLGPARAMRRAAHAQSNSLRLEQGRHQKIADIPLPAPPPSLSADLRQTRPAFFRKPETGFPQILQVPEGLEAAPEAWGKAARPHIDAALATTPAVLVRGAPLHEPGHFRAFLDGVGYEQEEYVGSFIERAVEDGLYDATANPSWYWLTPHNENVFYDKKPNKIIFSMVQPATEGGGETLLQTNDTLTSSVGQELIDHFNANGGLRYTRWYPTSTQKAEKLAEAAALRKQGTEQNNEGLKSLAGLQMMTTNIMPTWQEWVGTEDPNAARLHFEKLALNVQFDSEGGLIAWNVLPTTVPNPAGKDMWLNFADNDGIEPFFTISYGNGQPIPPEVRSRVKEAVISNCTAFPLQQGDVIFFDNIHCQHGRTPFKGKRKLLVEMSK